MQPLSSGRRWWLLLSLSVVAFLQILDLTIANVALSTIAGDLGSSVSQSTWVITSFGVANAISIPLTGWLARRFGEVRLFLVSTLLFIASSWLCGVANSLEMLIAGRLFQGAVAGPLLPLSQSLLLANFPQAQKNMALSAWSMTVILAPICGPILGGWISDNYHWGWIFFINIPFGLAAVAIVALILRQGELPQERLTGDYVGLSLLILGIGCFQLMLDRGKELDWFNSTEIIVLAVVALVSLMMFTVWELTVANPIVDLSLFKSRNFTVGTLCISLAFLLHIGVLVLQPQLFQMALGYTATWAGWVLAPIGIIPVFLAPLIGAFANKTDMRYLVSCSFIMFACCFFWRAYTFEAGMDFASAAWPQFIQGIAIACFIMPLNVIILSDIPPERVAAASSLFNFFRTLATSIGTSLTNTLWTWRENVHHSQLTEAITQNNPLISQTLRNLEQHGLSEIQAKLLLASQITRQGQILAANEIFWLYGYFFLALIVLLWLAKSSLPVTNGV